MTKYPDLFAALASPFTPEEVKTMERKDRQGKVTIIYYVTARVVMNRLDNVLGPENWWDAYPQMTENSVLCGLTIRLPDGTTLTKFDAGGAAGMADAGDDDKSMFSDAFKRAAVRLGVARYLYRDGVPSFTSPRSEKFTAAPGAIVPVNGHTNGRTNGQLRGKGEQHFPGASNPAIAGKVPAAGPIPPRNGPESNGSALFDWAKATGVEEGVNLLQYLAKWGKQQKYPIRIKDWSPDQARRGYSQAHKALDGLAAAE